MIVAVEAVGASAPSTISHAGRAKSPPRPRSLQRDLIVHPPQIAPRPCRSLMVEVIEDYDSHGQPIYPHAFYPVLHTESRYVHRYTMELADGYPWPAECRTHADFMAGGWTWEGEHVLSGVVYWADGESLFSVTDNPHNGAYQVVDCTWPAEEDEGRLASIVADLRQQLIARQNGGSC